MNWRLVLIQTNLLLFGCFRKDVITHSFANDPNTLYNQLNASRHETWHENMWISKTQCWALFIIYKATFTKTAIGPKFVDTFSLQKCCNWSVYYTIPEFPLYCFLPFYSINIFRKDFSEQPSAVNSRVLHDDFLVACYVLTTGPTANRDPSFTWGSHLRVTAN